MSDTLRPYIIEYTTADGVKHVATARAYTATDAVTIYQGSGIPSETVSAAWRLHTARLAPISSGRLVRAATLVARDQVQGVDEWIEQGFVMVREAAQHARNILRLPEAPYVTGAYPIDDDGSDLATAYRRVLEATPEELDAIPAGDSVRLIPGA